jgi:hypothetical protein
MGAPLLFAVLCVIALALQQRYAGLAFAAIAGWRFAYHLHFWGADEYGGAYTSGDAYRRARVRYWCFGALYALGAAGAVLLVT